MQRRQLDRNAGVLTDIGAGGAGIQRRDGIGIGAVIAQRVGFGARRFAQHVERIEIALAGVGLAAPHRLVDVFAEHELLAHLAHRRGHCASDDGLAQPPHHGAQDAFDAAFTILQNLAGQRQRPGRGVDEDRRRAAGVFGPVMRRDLVADQFVDGLRIGHPQERLGQAHQRHALAARQAIFRQKLFHQPGI